MTHLPRRGRLAQNLLIVLALAASMLVVTSVQSLVSSPSRATLQSQPNVVVIMADDMRADDLHWMPKTRRLIAGNGARFTNSFAPFPLCCPARASFLTGQYTHNHGVWSVRPPYGFSAFEDSKTLPVWLQEAGYSTLFLGKYLNGYGKQPTHDGVADSTTYVPPGWTDWRGSIDGGLPPDDPDNGSTYRYHDMTLNDNGTLEPHPGEYSTRMLGQQSVDLVSEYAPDDQPFFLWANFVAPHHGMPREPDDPSEVPRNDGKTTRIVTPAVPAGVRGRFDDRITQAPGLPSERDVSDKPSSIRSLPPINALERAAMLEAARQRAESESVLDDQVERIVNALRANGELANTYLIFTSDNGYFQGEHRLRQGKTLPYEPSLRTPTLIRGPGIPHGVNRSTEFLSTDFAPTILRAAGATVPASVDGQSRLGVARDGGNGWRRPVLTVTGPGSSPDGTVPSSAGVRVPRFLYVEHVNGEKELYDMSRGDKQLNSVHGHAQYADAQARLARILDDLRRCAGQRCRRLIGSW